MADIARRRRPCSHPGVQGQVPAQTPVEAVLEQREDTGGFDLVHLEMQVPLASTAIPRERSAPDAQYRFAIAVTDGQPASIDKVEFEDLPIPRRSEGDVLASLEAQLLADKGPFSGASKGLRRCRSRQGTAELLRMPIE